MFFNLHVVINMYGCIILNINLKIFKYFKLLELSFILKLYVDKYKYIYFYNWIVLLDYV